MQHRIFRPPIQHVVSVEMPAQWIGPIAYQYTIEILRDCSRNGKIDKMDFVKDGRCCA
ncbi:hypothetical protein LMG28138_05322 [Pararobbsia alpina]|uniref:Uncharacterized protein n=1 Tax=Pararobbsia alpina TaxID=621374 RepID=A0A6S7BUL7_9BURK|nr:hypothetical protein LMG28138_05322 [Pararobbsia alpina]